MKTVILAGGFGTRISEQSHLKPKPMIEIGDRPILWHIMKSYSHYGHHDFIICAGYKQNMIKQYFSNYSLQHADVTFDFTQDNAMVVHHNKAEPWRVTVVDTGLHTMTGGRIQRIEKYLGEDERFFMTYGDGVSDIDLNLLADKHRQMGRKATLLAVQPGGRFGALDINAAGGVDSFAEKTLEDGGWINGGFMVLERDVLSYIGGDATVFEQEPLERLAQEGQLSAFQYSGFWQCMDTLRDMRHLNGLIERGEAPWMVWEHA